MTKRLPHPPLAGRVNGLRASVFAALAAKMRARPDLKIVPLHIGDTYLPPPPEAAVGHLSLEKHKGLYAYVHPHGLPALVTALAKRLRERRGMTWVDEHFVQVTAGSTHGLAASCLTILDPGDKVLLLGPYWPLIPGCVRSASGEPVEVPFFDRLGEQGVREIVEPCIDERVRAIYVNSPNNPSGLVLDEAHLRALAELAQERGLWVISDEAYADYVYADGKRHVSIATLPGMAERTVTAFTFSKSHALAGHRVGYVTGPADFCDALRRVSTHTLYCNAVATQLSALAALEHGDAWQAETRRLYARAAATLTERLKLPHRPAEGGSFLFVDLRPVLKQLGGLSVEAFIDRALDAGVSISTGSAFGPSYEPWARLCFTAVPIADLEAACDALNRVIS